MYYIEYYGKNKYILEGDFLSNFTKREQIVILIFVSVIMIGIGYEIFAKRDLEVIKLDRNSEYIEMNDFNIENYEDNQVEKKKEEETYKKIIVHIDGEVVNPGVIELNEGARVIDAVNIAGGLTQYADEKRINLAKKLYDEEKIYIPKVGEDTFETDETYNSYTYDVNNSNQRRININTASKEELQSLPGIGPALAERIIEYREKQKFISIDDIKKVSGIGDKKFEAIKDLIVVK